MRESFRGFLNRTGLLSRLDFTNPSSDPLDNPLGSPLSPVSSSQSLCRGVHLNFVHPPLPVHLKDPSAEPIRNHECLKSTATQSSEQLQLGNDLETFHNLWRGREAFRPLNCATSVDRAWSRSPSACDKADAINKLSFCLTSVCRSVPTGADCPKPRQINPSQRIERQRRQRTESVLDKLSENSSRCLSLAYRWIGVNHSGQRSSMNATLDARQDSQGCYL